MAKKTTKTGLQESQSQPSPSANLKLKIIVGAGVVAISALLFLSKSLFLAATVNGTPVFRLSIIKNLEKKSGKEALEAKVTKILVFQEAARQNILVSPEEINDQISKIEASLASQNQNLTELLALDGITRDEFANEIKIQKIVEKILSDKIQVTDEEVTAFLEKNKSSIPKDTELGKLKEDVKTQLARSKLGTAYTDWVQGLKEKASISYFVNY